MAKNVAWIITLLAASSCPCFGQYLEIDQPANDIAFNAQTGMIYAAVPSSAGLPYGNDLIEISPVDGSITRSVFVGSEPFTIGMSPDAPVAYVGLSGAPWIYPVDLTTMTVGTGFSLGNTTYNGPRFAAQIAVMPGSPGTVAVSRRNHGYSPNYAGVAIYDDGVARTNADNSFTGGNTIAFGSQTSTLYGYTNETSDFTLRRYAIDPSGVSIATSAGSVISGYNVKIITRGDTILATSGAAVDGTQLALMGTYSIPGSGYANAVTVDDATSSVFFAAGDVVYAFDRRTFVPTGTLTIPANGGAVAATNCGTACVAVAYDSAQIFIASVPNLPIIFRNGFE